MSQSPNDNNSKKEAAKFFNSWMTSEHHDQWDEVCLQWCKQQQKAREQGVDPQCSMLCLKRPFIKENTGSWNPFQGYAITVLKGKEDCAEHMQGMKSIDENKQNDIMDKETLPIKYEIDLGNVWSDTEIKAKQMVNDKIIPYYNSAIEQAIGWKDTPQGVHFQNTVKNKMNTLLHYVYPLSPLKTNKDSTSEKKE